MSRLIARRYAKALLEVCQEQHNLEAVFRDLNMIHQLLVKSTELVRFLDNPIIPAQKREIVLKEMFHEKIEALTYRFLLFLEAKRRLSWLKEICEAFDSLCHKLHGIVKTKWVTSSEIFSHDIHLVSEYLKKKFGSEIEFERKIDPDILGGIKVQVGDVIYDHTLRAQLRKFKQNIMSG